MLVRWYLAHSLNYRDIEDLALERDFMEICGSLICYFLIDFLFLSNTSFCIGH
jgi:hypothetical protein